MLYRIFTENKNRGKVTDLIKKYFADFTIFTAFGYWQGRGEDSLIIEIYKPDHIHVGYKIGELAKVIKELNNQDAVLVQEIECKANLI